MPEHEPCDEISGDCRRRFGSCVCLYGRIGATLLPVGAGALCVAAQTGPQPGACHSSGETWGSWCRPNYFPDCVFHWCDPCAARCVRVAHARRDAAGGEPGGDLGHTRTWTADHGNSCHWPVWLGVRSRDCNHASYRGARCAGNHGIESGDVPCGAQVSGNGFDAALSCYLGGPHGRAWR